MTFEGRQSVVATLVVGQELTVARDVRNPADPNAIAILTDAGAQVGYLRKQISAVLAPIVDSGAVRYTACVSEVTGGTDGRSLGVNVRVSRVEALRDDEAAAQEHLRTVRSSARQVDPCGHGDGPR